MGCRRSIMTHRQEKRAKGPMWNLGGIERVGELSVGHADLPFHEKTRVQLHLDIF